MIKSGILLTIFASVTPGRPKSLESDLPQLFELLSFFTELRPLQSVLPHDIPGLGWDEKTILPRADEYSALLDLP